MPVHPKFPLRVIATQTFPPVIGVDLLGSLLGKAASSVIRDHSQSPEKLPPSYRAPGSKAPLWLLSEVIAWVKAHPVADEPKPLVKRHAGPGRPRKVVAVAEVAK